MSKFNAVKSVKIKGTSHVIVDNTPNITVSNFPANQPVAVSNVAHNIIDNFPTVQEIGFNETATDAFNRLRVCEPKTLFEISFIIDSNNIQTCNKTTGTGSVTRENTHMKISTLLNTDTVMLRSRQRGIYQPGKSLLIMMTGVLNYGNNDSTCVSRIGYYDPSDGFFFELLNNALFIVRRSSSTGSLVETRILINYALNYNKTQIFFFDMEWLGVGSVRCGVILDGVMVVLHKWNHANSSALPYIQMASLFCCYELLGGVGSILVNCMTCISEGGFTVSGRLFSIDNQIVARAVINASFRPIIAMRIKSGSKVNVYIQSLAVITISASNIHYELLIFRDNLNFTLTGASWIDNFGTDSNIQYDVSASAITFSDTPAISAGYIGKSDNAINLQTGEYNNIILTTNIDGISDILVLVARTISGNESTLASVLFKELL